MRRAFGISILLSALLFNHACCARDIEAPATQPAPASRPATTGPALGARALFVVRHGDVDKNDKSTLTPLGFARADDLAAVLKDAGITRIFVSEEPRTQQTAAPLARRLGITPDAGLTHNMSPQQLIEYVGVHSNKDDIVLIVFHHSRIPELLGALGDPDKETIREGTFDRLFLFLPDPAGGPLHVIRGRYGKPSGGGIGQQDTRPAEDKAGLGQ